MSIDYVVKNRQKNMFTDKSKKALKCVWSCCTCGRIHPKDGWTDPINDGRGRLYICSASWNANNCHLNVHRHTNVLIQEISTLLAERQPETKAVARYWIKPNLKPICSITPSIITSIFDNSTENHYHRFLNLLLFLSISVIFLSFSLFLYLLAG